MSKNISANIPAEIDALLVRSSAIFIHDDETTPTTAFEMRLAKAELLERGFAVRQEGLTNLEEFPFEHTFSYQDDEQLFSRAKELVKEARAWFAAVGVDVEAQLARLPDALLEHKGLKRDKNFAPALVVAYSNAEVELERLFITEPGERPASMWTLIEHVHRRLGPNGAPYEKMDDWWKDMLQILHNGRTYDNPEKVGESIEEVRRTTRQIIAAAQGLKRAKASAGAKSSGVRRKATTARPTRRG